MTRPSPFEIMRRNRERRRNVATLIEDVEAEIERKWAADRAKDVQAEIYRVWVAQRAQMERERAEHFIDTWDRLRATREEISMSEPPYRRWWKLWAQS